MASTVGSRLAFEKAKEGIQRAGFSLGQAVLSQSYLRLEVSLSTSITNYQFPVLVNDVSASATAATNLEQRLNLQDAFYVSQIGLSSVFQVQAPQQISSCVLIQTQPYSVPQTPRPVYSTGITVHFL